jgi:hypothetical protein
LCSKQATFEAYKYIDNSVANIEADVAAADVAAAAFADAALHPHFKGCDDV